MKIKKSQGKYLNFTNLAVQEFCEDIELDINDVDTMFYASVQKQLNLNLELNQKRKENQTKIKSQIENLID